ncbi:MAG TPA: hypothetical protein VH559_14750 [Gemmatimonadaceae bacterium]|jgi:hypothetical protein
MSRIRGIVIALLTGLVGCNEPTSANDFVEVSLTTDRQVVTPSTPAAITVSIVNRSDRSVDVADPRSYACMPPYSVETERGDAVPAPSRVCDLILYAPVSLAPGASLTIRDSWSGEGYTGQFANAPLPSGRYRLAARVVAGGHLVAGEPVVISLIAPD